MRSIALLVLAGCGATSGSAGSSSSLECGPVITSMFQRSVGFARDVFKDQRPELTQQLASLMERVEPVMVQSCREDGWSVELLRCADEMTPTDDPHKCSHLLTSDQAVKLSRRVMAVMMPPPASSSPYYQSSPADGR